MRSASPAPSFHFAGNAREPAREAERNSEPCSMNQREGARSREMTPKSEHVVGWGWGTSVGFQGGLQERNRSDAS